jgi:hypothetical protein
LNLDHEDSVLAVRPDFSVTIIPNLTYGCHPFHLYIFTKNMRSQGCRANLNGATDHNLTTMREKVAAS